MILYQTILHLHSYPLEYNLMKQVGMTDEQLSKTPVVVVANIDSIAEEYNLWLQRHGYPAMSADELAWTSVDGDDDNWLVSNNEHRAFLKWFIDFWDEVQHDKRGEEFSGGLSEFKYEKTILPDGKIIKRLLNQPFVMGLL